MRSLLINTAKTSTKTVSAEPVEVRPSGSHVIDRRPATGAGLTVLVAVDRFTRNFMMGSRI